VVGYYFYYEYKNSTRITECKNIEGDNEVDKTQTHQQHSYNQYNKKEDIPM